jgi:hypothetical protein
MAAAESKFIASMSTTPTNEDTSDTPTRMQKEPNLLHIGFQCACRLPFLPSSAIEAAVAAPVANRTMMTWDMEKQEDLKKISRVAVGLKICQICYSTTQSLYKYITSSFHSRHWFWIVARESCLD